MLFFFLRKRGSRGDPKVFHSGAPADTCHSNSWAHTKSKDLCYTIHIIIHVIVMATSLPLLQCYWHSMSLTKLVGRLAGLSHRVSSYKLPHSLSLYPSDTCSPLTQPRGVVSPPPFLWAFAEDCPFEHYITIFIHFVVAVKHRCILRWWHSQCSIKRTS